MVSYSKVLLLAALLVLCMSPALGFFRCGPKMVGVCVPPSRYCSTTFKGGCTARFKCCKFGNLAPPDP